MITARVEKHKIEDLSQRTPIQRVFAYPDGTWGSETAAAPVRAQDEQGEWHDVDTTLVKTDDGYAPKRALGDVVLSDGGDATFASMTVDDHDLSWKWPTTLPAPEISGSTATYKDAVNGGDLVVTATAAGFSHNIVLNEAPANPVDFTVPVVTGGPVLSEAKSGELNVTTRSGDELVTAPQPQMYDSSTDADGEPTNVAPVDTTVATGAAGQTLTLSPDQQFLTAPQTVYPVTIDPSYVVTQYATGDTWALNTYPTNNHPNDPTLQVGTNNGGSTKNRAFVQFANGPWAGQVILDTNLKMRNYQATRCDGAYVRVSKLTQPWAQGTLTWNNQPANNGTGAVDDKSAFGASGCGAAGDMNWNPTAIVQSWSDGSSPNYGFRLAALDETNNGSFRLYRSIDDNNLATTPRLLVRYDSYPNTPGQVVLSPNNNGYTTTTTPTFSASVSDPDGGTVYGRFNIYDTSMNLLWYADGNGVGSGGTSTLTVPSGVLNNGTTYIVRAYGNDGSYYSGKNNTNGAGFTSATFTVDSVAPSATIASSAYPNSGTWVDATPSSNTFTIDGAADTTSFSVSQDGAVSALGANGSGDAVTSWNPANGSHTFSVTPRDRAGNVGAAVTFSFGNGASLLNAPAPGDRSSSTFPVQASAPPGATSAAIQWRFAPDVSAGSTPDATTGWINATKLSTQTGSAWTGAVTSDSGGSATPRLVWNAVSESGISTSALVEVRTVFSYASGITKVSPLQRVTVVPHAFGGNFPSSEAGPGQVALTTGELQYTTNDVSVPGYGGDLTLSRAHLSLGGAPAGPASVFGPGWIADLSGPADGEANLSVIDRTAADGSFVLLSPKGDSYTYRHISGTTGADQVGTYVGVGETGQFGDNLLLSAANETGLTHRLVLTELDGATTTFVRTAASTWTVEKVAGAQSTSTTSFVHDSDGSVTWIIAPSPTGVTCSTTVQQPGCRALELRYMGTGSGKRLTSVDLHVFNPQTGPDGRPGSNAGMDTITVMKYTYDASGQLVASWDPRLGDGSSALKTQYEYTAVNNRVMLKTLTPPGLQPWSFNYEQTGSEAGRLTSITRPQDSAIGGSPATWTIRYDIPLSGGGLPNLTSDTTSTWDQPADGAPSTGAAVWGPESVPEATPTAENYQYANLIYWTRSGRLTNSASFGAGAWQIESQRYDAGGNIFWRLSTKGRSAALSAGGSRETTASAADDFATWTVYNNAGSRVQETYSPMQDFVLNDGTTMTGRSLKQTIYDGDADATGYLGGRPTTNVPDGGFGLPVREILSATSRARPGGPGQSFDKVETDFKYAPLQSGDGDGWVLRMPTQVLRQDGSGWATETTRFDDEGKVFEFRTPQSNASTGSAADTRTSRTVFYSAGTGASRAECQNRPQWAGLACWRGPAGQPSSGTTIPDTWVAAYSAWLAPTRMVSTSGTASKVTVTGYDAAGRGASASLATSGLSTADRPLSGTSTIYSASTGLPTSVSDGTRAETTNYDSWGRVVSRTDGTGGTSTTSYDRAGRIAVSSDGKGTSTFSYNGTDSKGRIERRGLLTSLDVGLPSGAKTFTGAYDESASLTQQQYPGGLVANLDRDVLGQTKSLTYSQSGNTLLAFSRTFDVMGKVRTQSGPASSQVETYDDLNRLTRVQETTQNGCSSRTYGLSKDGDRTSLTSYAPSVAAGQIGACQTQASTVVNSTFDDADRIVTGGYTYDALGRTKSLPSADTSSAMSSPGNLDVTYSVNDMVATLSQSGTVSGAVVTKSQDFSLDVSGRLSVTKTSTNGALLSEETAHYSGDSPDVAWIDSRNRTDASAAWVSSWARNISGLDGRLALIQGSDGSATVQLADMGGNIVAQAQVSSTSIASYFETDEYGVKRNIASSSTRYGWLGAKVRQANGILGGGALMGARLYNPATGMFTSRDFVPGGNTTPYIYPTDPINQSDASGYATRTKSDSRIPTYDIYRFYFNKRETYKIGRNLRGAAIVSALVTALVPVPLAKVAGAIVTAAFATVSLIANDAEHDGKCLAISMYVRKDRYSHVNLPGPESLYRSVYESNVNCTGSYSS